MPTPKHVPFSKASLGINRIKNYNYFTKGLNEWQIAYRIYYQSSKIKCKFNQRYFTGI